MEADSERNLVEDVCLPFLLRAQNGDGGWGFLPGSASRAESTCWALLGLMSVSTHTASEAVARALPFLRAAQLADGSWASTAGEKTGCWVTSLAAWTLFGFSQQPPEAAAALRWICEDWPADSTPWRRFLAKFSSQRDIAPVNNALRGWGWSPGTSSWVEPTSFALLALGRAPADQLPAEAADRRRLGEALLYDRMCLGGGWNCGNPNVYGVAGEPLVGPTVWALLALREQMQREENRSSVAWLEASANSVEGANSVALARICLAAYGRCWPPGALQMRTWLRADDYPLNVQGVALTCVALSERPPWFLSLRSEERTCA
jgi:hypothetical protein